MATLSGSELLDDKLDAELNWDVNSSAGHHLQWRAATASRGATHGPNVSRATAAPEQQRSLCTKLTENVDGQNGAPMLRAEATAAAPESAPLTMLPTAECSICSAVVAPEQGGCLCPARSHLICDDCFDGWTKAQCDQSSDGHAPHDLGNVWCPCKPGPGGKGCASKVPFAASVIVRHIKPDTLDAYLEARTFAAIAQRTAQQQRASPANNMNAGAVIARPTDLTRGPRHHIIEEILTLRCPCCRQAFCDWEACLALTCKCGCSFCAVCGAECRSSKDAHTHVREQCAFFHLRGHASADLATAQQAQNACRVSKLRVYLAPYEPSVRAQIVQSVRRELLDLGLPADELAVAPAACPVAIAEAPDHWTIAGAMGGEVSFVSVMPGSDMWNSVMKLAGDTAKHILAVEHVQNAALWDAFVTQRGVLERKYAVGLHNGGLRVDTSMPGIAPAIVQSLWHGTRGTDLYEIARSATGFCASFARDKSKWGRGVYFSRHAAYSHSHFAHPYGATQSRIILADVLVGAAGEAASAATRPPELDADHPWHQHLANSHVTHRCDSATPSKVTKARAMFVTFGVGTALAYPRYIITLNLHPLQKPLNPVLQEVRTVVTGRRPHVYGIQNMLLGPDRPGPGFAGVRPQLMMTQGAESEAQRAEQQARRAEQHAQLVARRAEYQAELEARRAEREAEVARRKEQRDAGVIAAVATARAEADANSAAAAAAAVVKRGRDEGVAAGGSHAPQAATAQTDREPYDVVAAAIAAPSVSAASQNARWDVDVKEELTGDNDSAAEGGLAIRKASAPQCTETASPTAAGTGEGAARRNDGDEPPCKRPRTVPDVHTAS